MLDLSFREIYTDYKQVSEVNNIFGSLSKHVRNQSNKTIF